VNERKLGIGTHGPLLCGSVKGGTQPDDPAATVVG
jgi:hypothetical protein